MRINFETEKPTAIPKTKEPKYKMKFSAERIRNILPLVIPINWNRPISFPRRLMKIVFAYNRKMDTIATSKTEAALIAAPP